MRSLAAPRRRRGWPSGPAAAWLIFTCSVAACSEAQVRRGAAEPDRPGATSPTRAGGGGAGSPSDPSISIPDAAAPGDGPGPSNQGACARETKGATRQKTDVLFLVDASGSMSSGIGGGKTRWSAVNEALVGFVNETGSQGVGVGLQLFPPAGAECKRAADCGRPPGGNGTDCVGVRPVCISKDPKPILLSVFCSTDAECRGGKCVDRGNCSVTLQPCGEGLPDCAAGSTCDFPVGRCAIPAAESCAPARFAAPGAAIVDLPGGAPGFADALQSRRPEGETPMRAAVAGALAHLRAARPARPDRKVALVLMTDGFPSPDQCPPAGLDAVAAVLQAASDPGAPGGPIPTFVIGIFAPEEVMAANTVLRQLALAGGTEHATVLDAREDLATRLRETLAQVRGLALSCELAVPMPPPGRQFDWARTGLRYVVGGRSTELVQVANPLACDPVRGGWYFDPDPGKGGVPSKAILCDASCRTINQDPTGTTDLVLACGDTYIP